MIKKYFIGKAVCVAAVVCLLSAGLVQADDMLSYGMSGEQVLYVQQLLTGAGYMDSAADGIFGEATESAVYAFQRAAGLYADGIVGPSTLQALESAAGSAPAPAQDTPQDTHENSAPGTSSELLSYGSAGDQVVRLQQTLKDLGYGITSADGVFGSETERAVREFQQANGLYTDGIAGPATQNALFSGNGVPANQNTQPSPQEETPTAPADTQQMLSYGSRGDTVRQVQQKLKDLGYTISSVDGIYGQESENAVKAYQQAEGLYVDGIAGPATIKRLLSEESSSAPAPAAPEGPTLTYGTVSDAVRDLQQKLKDLGYRITSADGAYGTETQNAVRVFQKSNGLEATGTADAATIAKLSDNPVPYDPDNDEDLPEVRRLARAKLNEIGWDLYRAYQWSVNIPYIPEDTAYSVTGGALYAFHNNKGDCIAKAASFCVMARELGYPCNVIWGQVPLARGGMSPHAWTEIVSNGSTYVCDPDFEWDEKRNGYMINYGQSGTWRYQKDSVWTD